MYGINVETSGPTARGLFHAMKLTNNFINNSDDLKNLGMVDHLSHIGFNLYTDLVAGDDGTYDDF